MITARLQGGFKAFMAAVLALSLAGTAPAVAFAADAGAAAGTYKAASIANGEAPLSYKARTVSKTYGARFTNKLAVNTDAPVAYSSSNRKVATVDATGRVAAKGMGTATIKATSPATAACAAGSASYKLVVTPRAVALKSLKAAKGGFQATWAKGSKADTTGYQIRYSKYRDLSGARTKKVAKRTTASTVLKKLSGPANCFAQVRAYAKGKDGRTYYGAWSKTKQVIGSLNSGDKVLDADVKALIKRFGTGDGALKAAFDYITDLRYKSAATNLKGAWTKAAAKKMYRAKAGNCYEKAALLGWVAKGLGYNANPVAGKLVNVKLSGEAVANPHGWVEVRWNGKKLFCDPDTTKTLKGLGAKEVRGHSTYLYLVENGKPYTYKR